MKYVYGMFFHISFFAAAFLAGCKDPDVQVASLGKKLPAPSLKGTSPFSQNFDLQGYARIEGSCDSRVGDVSISFDNLNWHKPPTSPNVTGTGLAGTSVVNDINCEDGVFDVYITNNDLLNTWNIQPGSNSKMSIYIKGETLIGDTQTLILTEPESKPTKITLEKTWPNGFAGSGQCESFHANLQDDTGRRASTSTDITFNIESLISGTAKSNISGFSNWQDCYNNVSSKTTFTVLANTDYVELFYRFPNAPINGTLSFHVINPSALVPDANYTQVVLRDSSASSTYQWLVAENPVYQLYKNICYPFKIQSYLYNHNPANQSGTIHPTSSTNLQFFDSSSCTTQASNGQYPLNSVDSSAIIYVKYVPTGSETSSFVPVTMSMTGLSASGSLYDFAPMQFSVDLTNNSTATHFEMWGPQNLAVSTCNRYYIIAMNNNHTWIPVTSGTQVNLSTQESGVGNFYASSTCDVATAGSTGAAISTLPLPAGSTGDNVYFKPANTTPGKYHFLISAANFVNLIREWILQ